MSAKKLQTEIDRTLKKVTEGLGIFHDTLDKLESAPTQALKEKFEVELKKEIKKLQRLRDLIKGWQAMNELKDKQAINDARKSIETEMEKFKILEREMKTKAFSKEGLSQAAKLDPLEQEKSQVATWVNAVTDKLSTQVDALEAELESLELQARKGKKMPNASKQERYEQIPSILERHNMHIRQLDKLLRLMANDQISPDQINYIRDDVEYYVDSHDDPDFVPDDELYEQFDVLEDDAGGASTDDDDDDGESDAVSSPTLSEPVVAAVAAAVPKKPVPAVVEQHQPSSSKKPVVVTSTAATANLPAKSATATVAEKKKSVDLSSSELSHLASSSTSTAPVKASGPSFASAILGASSTTTATQTASTILSQSSSLPLQQAPISFSAIVNPTSQGSSTQQSSSGKSHPYEELRNVVNLKAAANERSTEKRSVDDVMTILSSSFSHCPDNSELERSRVFTPKDPFKVPAYYPSHPPSILENPSIFERFELDTLFFIFYYQQKSYAQYLSAHELKRQSWRFHKKYLTWFQRHEEPKIITDDFEQGTYIYFDYEGSWCQRKKSEFTFEYRHLEDEETV